MLKTNNALSASTYEQKWIEGLNQGTLSHTEDIFHSDCLIHINGGPSPDLKLEEFKGMLKVFLMAFPDLHFTIEDQVMDNDKVCTRWTATGTNTGPMGEMSATGKQVKISGFIIDKLSGNKVSERWELWDQAAMLQQLGVLPS